VRFRTVVRDTQDTAFVIFAVVIGMAVGARDLLVAAIGFVVVSGAAFLMKPRAKRGATVGIPYVLGLRVGVGHDVETIAGGTLDTYMRERRLVSVNTARQGLALDVSFQGILRENTNIEEFVKAVNRIEGIERVELARRSLSEDP
jgi:hypothetical protein